MFIFSNFLAQENEIDSLLNAYKKTQENYIIQKAFSLVKNKKQYKILRKINIVYGLQSYWKSDTINILKSANNLFHLYKNYNDSLALAKALHYKALYHWRTFRFDSTYYYFNESKKISILLNDFEQAGRRLLSMSKLQNEQSDYLGAEQSATEALSYLEPIKNYRFIASCYNNLGESLLRTSRFKEARESLKKSFYFGYEILKEKPIFTYSYFYKNLAQSYQLEKNYIKSSELYGFLINDSIKKLDPLNYYDAVLGYNYNKFKTGNYKGVLDNFFKVMQYRKSIKDDVGITRVLSLITDYYKTKNELSKAKYYGLECIKYSKKTKNIERLLEAYLMLADIETGEKKNYYLREYIQIKDSVTNVERTLKNQFAKLRYEDEKRDLENTNLKLENQQKELAIEKEKQQKVFGLSLAGFSILCIGFGIIIVRNRNRKRAYEAKLKQIEVREEERQQIAKSLHDEVAGDIRMLHKKLVQKKLLEESKELNKVKDNVRVLSHQLSSVSFDDVSFKHQIINLVADYFDADFTINIKKIDTIAWKNINNSIKRVLFLCIRESIQNIEKYANATKVFIEFEDLKKNVKVSIKDDGKGFTIDKKRSGIGLKNMKERTEEIQGKFDIESNIGKGTKITLEIPIHEV